jgi:hypothetical protein
MKSFLWALIFTLGITQLNGVSALADSLHPNRQAVSLYFGPGTPTPLLDIARFKGINIDPYYIISIGYLKELVSWNEQLRFEAEGQLTKHLENWNLFSISGAIVVRWIKTPWSSILPGSSFAFGNGLSQATGIPKIEEIHLSRTSQLLYHFFLEFSLPFHWDESSGLSDWEALFRIHHRSGAFGLFNEVVGGSDFLCLGVRYRF